MTRRHKLVFTLVILSAMAITLTSIVRETSFRMQYGMASIRVGHRTVYVKARRCGPACRGELWLSPDSNRCQPFDPATDYTAQYDQLLYAVDGGTLVVVAPPSAITPPTQHGWIDLRVLPTYGHAADGYSLRYILFGDHLPERNVPGKTVSLSPCVRAFGHNW